MVGIVGVGAMAWRSCQRCGCCLGVLAREDWGRCWGPRGRRHGLVGFALLLLPQRPRSREEATQAGEVWGEQRLASSPGYSSGDKTEQGYVVERNKKAVLGR